MIQLDYINTNPLWDELSNIANEALGEIENVFFALENQDSNVKKIDTTRGKIYYDKTEDELYIDKKDGSDATPLREEETYTILAIADDINDFIKQYNNTIE